MQLIKLKKEGEYYIPKSDLDLILMQHLLNENFLAITEESIKKLSIVAAYHDMSIKIER